MARCIAIMAYMYKSLTVPRLQQQHRVNINRIPPITKVPIAHSQIRRRQVSL